MSDTSTRRIIDAYLEEAPAPMFLSSMLQTPPKNFHDSEEVELDIQRETDDVAVVLQDLTVGGRENQSAKYTNKSFKPPVYNEIGTLTAFDLLKRAPGQNPFASNDFQAKANLQALGIARKLENKVRRAIELMSAQMFTTGELILTDDAGVALYSLDYQPKATHFTTPTAWAADGTTGDPFLDIGTQAKLLRKDGRKRPDRLLFGATAWTRFAINAKVRSQLDNLGMQNLANIAPSVPGMDGASFMGWIVVDNYRFECWLYEGQYNNAQTGVLTPYIPDNKVVMMSSKARYDLSFGAIPRIGSPSSNALPFLPNRISGKGMDLSPWAWITPDGQHLKVSVGSRPLCIPVEIDTFGCMTVA